MTVALFLEQWRALAANDYARSMQWRMYSILKARRANAPLEFDNDFKEISQALDILAANYCSHAFCRAETLAMSAPLRIASVREKTGGAVRVPGSPLKSSQPTPFLAWLA
jgi:hypothetical protein